MKFTAHIITGALLLATPVALAQSANANASATIITSLSLVNTTPLSFGAIVPGSSAGTVVVSPTDGTRTLSGVTSGGGSGAAASFTATGTGNQSFTITLPSSINISDNAGTPHTMLVDTFTSDPSGTGTLSSGTATFGVGAKLHVAANQTPNAYSGSFTVSIVYQ